MLLDFFSKKENFSKKESSKILTEKEYSVCYDKTEDNKNNQTISAAINIFIKIYDKEIQPFNNKITKKIDIPDGYVSKIKMIYENLTEMVARGEIAIFNSMPLIVEGVISENIINDDNISKVDNISKDMKDENIKNHNISDSEKVDLEKIEILKNDQENLKSEKNLKSVENLKSEEKLESTNVKNQNLKNQNAKNQNFKNYNLRNKNKKNSKKIKNTLDSKQKNELFLFEENLRRKEENSKIINLIFCSEKETNTVDNTFNNTVNNTFNNKVNNTLNFTENKCKNFNKIDSEIRRLKLIYENIAEEHRLALIKAVEEDKEIAITNYDTLKMIEHFEELIKNDI